jgi:lipopolysaccharide export system permease protein
VIGYGLVAASAWNPWMNILQYLAPLVAVALAARLLFRALKPRRRREHPIIDRMRAQFRARFA